MLRGLLVRSFTFENCLVLIATLLSVLILTFAGPTAFAANSCKSVFQRVDGARVDGRYGRASQRDPELGAQGLISARGSQLCGPTCLFNGLEKFRHQETVEAQKANPALGRSGGSKPSAGQQIGDLVRNFFPRSSIVDRGARIETLADAFRKAMRAERFSGDVTAYSAVESEANIKRGLDPWHLVKSVDDNTVVVAKFGEYRETNLDYVSESNRVRGHYMIVAGYDPANPRNFYFIDPNAPRQLRVARLEGKYLPAYKDEVIIAKFYDVAGVETGTVIIDGLVVAQRSTVNH